MIWVVLLIIAVVAYFIIQGLHARHVSRCHTDIRTAQHVPDSVGVSKAQAEFHERSAATVAQSQRQRSTAPRMSSTGNAPSLLYADRPNAARNQLRNDKRHTYQNSQASAEATAQKTGNTQCNTNDNIDLDLASNATADLTSDTMDFTAEHVPMSESDVGIPANNSEYALADAAPNNANTGITAAGAAVAATAGVTMAAVATERDRTSDVHIEDKNTAPNNTVESVATSTTESIDLELGDSDNTYNDAEDIEGNNHDELLDFGDLTSDISDMLKELNLRETDSPRLEINKAEFEQLKTGEPGEVKPAKIENVAYKLRNMLQ